MNSTISKDKVSFCYKNTCISVKGRVVDNVVLTIAILVIVYSISPLLESSN